MYNLYVGFGWFYCGDTSYEESIGIDILLRSLTEKKKRKQWDQPTQPCDHRWGSKADITAAAISVKSIIH